MFSSVVKARDLGDKGSGKYDGEPGLAGKGVGEGERRDVAIKIVRSQESMCVTLSHSLYCASSAGRFVARPPRPSCLEAAKLEC